MIRTALTVFQEEKRQYSSGLRAMKAALEAVFDHIEDKLEKVDLTKKLTWEEICILFEQGKINYNEINANMQINEKNKIQFVSNPKPDDGWIEWKGGKQPIDDLDIEVKLRNGQIQQGYTASNFRWYHYEDDALSIANDIIAYRIIEEEEKKEPKKQTIYDFALKYTEQKGMSINSLSTVGLINVLDQREQNK